MFFRIKLVDKILNLYFKSCSQTELARKSVILGVFTSIFLILIKFIAWMQTDSISMRASMNDSVLDALTSFLAYYVLAFSSTSFDKEHNFGHEKVEGLMALFQCLLVIYSGIMIFVEAYEMFINPREINNSQLGIVVMVISCFAVYQLIYFQKYVAAKTDSMVVKGDSLHYLSDFLVNICIIISLIVSNYFVYVDALCGIVIGGYVLYSAFLILKNAVIDLMDESLPTKTVHRITEIIKNVEGVEKINRLRTRSAGMKKYIESCVKVDPKMSLQEADNVVKEIESKLGELFEKVDIVVKAEP